MSKKKETRGKPSRYEGEESTRLSILLRPRYRQAVELIARDRESTLGEVVELAIAQLASKYEIEGQPVIDFVRPKDELYKLIEGCLIPFDHESRKQIIALNKGVADAYLSNAKKLPLSLMSPPDRYDFEISIRTQDYLSSYFNIGHLSESAISEAWKTGLSVDEVIAVINQVLLDNGIREPFSEFF